MHEKRYDFTSRLWLIFPAYQRGRPPGRSVHTSLFRCALSNLHTFEKFSVPSFPQDGGSEMYPTLPSQRRANSEEIFTGLSSIR